MNHRKVVKYIGFFTAMLVLVAAPVYAPPRFAAHPAQIVAEGNLKLMGFDHSSVDVPVDVSFMAIVPDAIERGDYIGVDFFGFAVVADRTMVKIDGILNITDIFVWVKFDVTKPADPEIPAGRYSAQGEMNIGIAETTLPSGEVTWAMMKGRITDFGDTEAFGALMAHAKISDSNNFTKANGFFSLQPPETEETPGTRVYTFYIINLLIATKTELNTGGRNLYIEGNWSVSNRTTTITVQESKEINVEMTIKPLVENVTGKLSATLPSFNLTIPALKPILGADNITGQIVFFHFKFAKPFEHGIPMSDFNRDRLVNIQDIANMGKAFGAKLGSPRYNFDLDANQDFVINILDVAKAGQEFGEEY